MQLLDRVFVRCPQSLGVLRGEVFHLYRWGFGEDACPTFRPVEVVRYFTRYTTEN